jgi:acetyltransferase-like isoleucine patch superfamily enzyme
MINIVINIFGMFLPWRFRRYILIKMLGYKLHPTSKLGLAWVLPKLLILEEHSRIGNFTVCKGMDKLHLARFASIGRGNWISGYPSKGVVHYYDQSNRVSELVLGEHACITNRHIIDCTNSVIIGQYSTVAGYRSQILTHSVDLTSCRQHSAPVKIGEYCFVGTASIILGGCSLPDYSVLGALALLNKSYDQTYTLYGGVPAKPIEPLARDMRYFNRSVGFVT